MFMLKYCERKILFYGVKVVKLKQTGPTAVYDKELERVGDLTFEHQKAAGVWMGQANSDPLLLNKFV
jgi:hypothetical protein